MFLFAVLPGLLPAAWQPASSQACSGLGRAVGAAPARPCCDNDRDWHSAQRGTDTAQHCHSDSLQLGLVQASSFRISITFLMVKHLSLPRSSSEKAAWTISSTFAKRKQNPNMWRPFKASMTNLLQSKKFEKITLHLLRNQSHDLKRNTHAVFK